MSNHEDFIVRTEWRTPPSRNAGPDGKEYSASDSSRISAVTGARGRGQLVLALVRRPCMPPSTARAVPVVAPASGLAR